MHYDPRPSRNPGVTTLPPRVNKYCRTCMTPEDQARIKSLRRFLSPVKPDQVAEADAVRYGLELAMEHPRVRDFLERHPEG